MKQGVCRGEKPDARPEPAEGVPLRYMFFPLGQEVGKRDGRKGFSATCRRPTKEERRISAGYTGGRRLCQSVLPS